MRTAIITADLIDEDVCYGDFDGSYQRTTYVVNFFADGSGEWEDEQCFKTEEAANFAREKYESGNFTYSEYGGVDIDFTDYETTM